MRQALFSTDARVKNLAAEKKAGHLHEAEMETTVGVGIFKLNLLAYPDSADAHYNLADAYLQVGEKALALIDSHAAPLS
jgi:hypothetical protein